MMKVYTLPHTNVQVMTAMECPPGHVLAESPRPTINHYSTLEGTWEYRVPVYPDDIPFDEAYDFALLYPNIAKYI